MSDIRFDWDPKKASDNIEKHGVSFDESQTVFLDDNALILDDPDHSGAEERFLLLGMSERARILMVSHCYREREAIIRIISARRATARERATYQERQKR